MFSWKPVILRWENEGNWNRTHNHLVHKGTLNHLAKCASLAKWLSVRWWTKWLWVWVQLQSLKLQISLLLRAKSSLTFLDVRDITRTYSWKNELKSSNLYCCSIKFVLSTLTGVINWYAQSGSKNQKDFLNWVVWTFLVEKLNM